MTTAESQWGQRFFSVMSHSLYDWGLYRFFSETVWGCPTDVLLDHYVESVSDHHLDIGVGTGFLLERTLSVEHVKRLVLLDLNRRCLEKAARRLADLDPETRLWDIRRPIPMRCPENPFAGQPGQDHFGSIAMNYVLHCIPGGFTSNAAIFDNVAAMLEANGVFFGATVVMPPVSLRATLAMRALNACGIFHNTDDTIDELESVMTPHFSDIAITQHGSVVLFRAIKKRGGES